MLDESEEWRTEFIAQFQQLHDEAYRWVGENAAVLSQEMRRMAALRPDGPVAADKVVGMIDLRQVGSGSVTNITYADLTIQPVLICFPRVDSRVVNAIFDLVQEWRFPDDYAAVRASEAAQLLAHCGGLVLAFGDEPGSTGFKMHGVCAIQLPLIDGEAAARAA